MGVGDAELGELMPMVDLFSGFNKISGSLQTLPDVVVPVQ